MIMGLTGQIGSGKSTAAKILKSFGATIVSADRIGREVVENNPAVLKALAKAFGPSIINSTGKLNRKRLASLAFASDNSKLQLNRIVHPHLLKELKRQLKEKGRRNRFVVVDAALLLDWELDNILDLVLVIHASEKLRLVRLVERGMTVADARARQKRQLKFNEYRRRADYVVFNNQTPERLAAKLKKILTKEAPKDVDL